MPPSVSKSSVAFHDPPSPSSKKIVCGNSSSTRAVMYRHAGTGILYPASHRNPSTPRRHHVRNTSASSSHNAGLLWSNSTRSSHVTPHAPGLTNVSLSSLMNHSGCLSHNDDPQPV